MLRIIQFTYHNQKKADPEIPPPEHPITVPRMLYPPIQ